MKRHLLLIAVWGIFMILSACNLGVNPTPNLLPEATSEISLLVQVQNPTDTFDSVGDLINYNYIVTNAGAEPLVGPVQVNDNIATETCPDLTTIGNNNDTLDPTESITCTGSYPISQADLNTGSVTNSVTASLAGGTILSAANGVTVNLAAAAPEKTLGLTKTASPLTYNLAGQTITYTYVIANTGTLAIGPTQFIVTDNYISGPINCGANETTLNPGQTVSCTATYAITQQDMVATSVTNSATASGGDAQPSAAVSATVTNSNFQGNVTPTIISDPSNLTPGSTIQHVVSRGEWLIQIARCYGVTFESIRNANWQISNPNLLSIDQVVTVPNIGSAGTIFGRPCVKFHTVASGDTWNSIATQYKARVDVLQVANPNGLITGKEIKVPVNSAAPGVVPIPPSGGVAVTPVTATGTPVTSTPTPTATTSTTTPGGLTRINIPAGQNSATVSGTLVGHETVSYVLAGTTGQTLTVTLTAPVNEIGIRIYDPAGILIRQLDTNPTWTGSLSVNGDYRIDLVGLTDPSKNFSLTVALTNP